jgi:hypothetical protein
MKVSKNVNNSKQWAAVTGIAQTGIYVTKSDRNNYYFGLEEWNNSELLKKHKLAYLDSFRSFPRFDYYEKIELISYNNQIVHHVGTLKGVSRIKGIDIQKIRRTLINENWLEKVEKDFHDINDLRLIESNTEYMKCWNSDDIVAPTNQGFILNIKYEELDYFQVPVNLTEQNPRVNRKWRRLIHLYELNNDYQNLFNL